jgi:predicted deacylase
MTALLERIGEGLWLADGPAPGTSLALAFGVHGDERAPVEAGQLLLGALERGELALERGRLLLVHANPRASEQGRRWSEGGVDLNRCFQRAVLEREPALFEPLFEEARAREITTALERARCEVLADFHCTVEPGRRFLMHHPGHDEPGHRRVAELLSAEVVLADPGLCFGGVSLDEWLSTRGRVGICYETGWLGDPANTPAGVLSEMQNLIAGLGLAERAFRRHGEKQRFELESALACAGPGFAWRNGVGENLQELPAGTLLGAYADGGEVRLEHDAALVFPKKRPELVQVGKPLVYLARRR